MNLEKETDDWGFFVVLDAPRNIYSSHIPYGKYKIHESHRKYYLKPKLEKIKETVTIDIIYPDKYNKKYKNDENDETDENDENDENNENEKKITLASKLYSGCILCLFAIYLYFIV